MSAQKSHLRRLAFWPAYLLIVSVLGLLLLEALCRLLDPMGISYYPDTARFMDGMIIEEPIGYRNAPNLDAEFHGVRVRTNAHGLRHQDIEAEANDEVFRIMFLGDSVVFGVGVEQDSTLPAQLERSLEAYRSPLSDKPVEVINMGCISYNTEQELIQYQQLGQRFKPDLLLLMFSSNDIEPKMWIFDRRRNPLIKIAQKSYAASFLFLLKRRVQGYFAGADSDNYIKWSAYEERNPRWLKVKDSLNELHGMANSQNIPFVVLGQGRANRSWNMVARVAAAQGFEAHLIDPFADARWRDLDPAAFFTKRGGGHLGAEGLMMYSELVLELLIELELVGESDAGDVH